MRSLLSGETPALEFWAVYQGMCVFLLSYIYDSLLRDFCGRRKYGKMRVVIDLANQEYKRSTQYRINLVSALAKIFYKHLRDLIITILRARV